MPSSAFVVTSAYLRVAGLAIVLAAASAALVLLLLGQRELQATATFREEVIADLRVELAVMGSRLEAQERTNAHLTDGLRDLHANVLAESQATDKANARRLAAVQSQKARSGGGTKLYWPADGRVTSGFGDGRGHEGIDIAAWPGMPVRAAAKGTVVERGWDDRYGNYIVIDHGERRRTVYAHLHDVFVGYGSVPSRATVIGTAGCTGTCTGPHLHFEVRVKGVPTDPLRYLR